MLPFEGECINVEEGLILEGEIVRYSSVSLSPTLGRNEKVEQYIRKKTHKPIVRYSSVSLSLTLNRNEKVEQHIRNKTHKMP